MDIVNELIFNKEGLVIGYRTLKWPGNFYEQYNNISSIVDNFKLEIEKWKNAIRI